MAPKKRRKNAPKKVKKAAPKKNIKKTAAKKPVVEKKAVKKAAPEIPAPKTGVSRGARPGQPCICIENEEGWFCMKQLPSGELKECDGPFDTKEECESHTCR